MPLPSPLGRQRFALAGALYASAVASAGWGAMHAAASGAALFFCGPSAGAHCLACYAAPMLAAAGVAVLLVPQARRAPVRR